MQIERGLFWITFYLTLGSVCLTACGPSQAELDATATQFTANIFATQTAQAPTSTSTPTPTHTPTLTPTFTSTATFTPTSTASPTSTPTLEPGTVITSTLDNGWVLYEAVADGFAIALPPEWIHIGLNPSTFKDLLAIEAELDPEMGEILESETFRNMIANGLKFYAFDLSQEAMKIGQPAAINIFTLDLGMKIPLDVLVPLTLEQVESIADPAYPITHQRVQLTNVAAEQLTYTGSANNFKGDQIPMMIMQYLVIDGSMQYVITLGAPKALDDTYSNIFEDIGESFRLMD